MWTYENKKGINKEWNTIPNQGNKSVYSLANIFVCVWRMTRVWQAAWNGEMRNSWTIFIKKHNWNSLVIRMATWEENIKICRKEIRVWRCRLNGSGLGRQDHDHLVCSEAGNVLINLVITWNLIISQHVYVNTKKKTNFCLQKRHLESNARKCVIAKKITRSSL